MCAAIRVYRTRQLGSKPPQPEGDRRCRLGVGRRGLLAGDCHEAQGIRPLARRDVLVVPRRPMGSGVNMDRAPYPEVARRKVSENHHRGGAWPDGFPCFGNRFLELTLCPGESGTQIASPIGVVTMVMEVGHTLAWPVPIPHIRERPGSRRKSRENQKQSRSFPTGF